MKKIITAAAIAAMAASFAAADVKVGLNARVRPDLYSVTHHTEKGDKDAYNETTYAGLGKTNGFAESKDTFSVNGSTDYAGVVAEATFVSPQDSNTTGSVGFDNYYAWLNWGALKFTAGVYDSRYTSRGNYTATDQGILDEEFSKTMGLAIKNGISSGAGWLGDFGNVSQINGSNLLSFLVDYTFQDVGGGSLLLKGGLVQNPTVTLDKGTTTYSYAYWDGAKVAKTKESKEKEFTNTDEYKAAKKAQIEKEWILLNSFSTTKDAVTWGGSYDSYKDGDKNSFLQESGYVFEAAWRKDDAVALDFIFKNPVNKAYGFGLYVTPLFIPNTKNVVLGFTYGTQEDFIKSAFAIDFRGQYNITPEAIVALGAKYESLKFDVDGADTESAMQIAGEFSYKINDVVTAALDLGYFNKDLDNNDENDDDNSQFIVTSLRGKFTAGKNAAITTALRLNKVLNPSDGSTDYTFDIPVVLRVKM